MFLGACLRAMPGSPARKKPPPRRYPAHSGRHPARQTGTGHAAEAQGIPDQTSTADGRSPARGRAGGVQREAAESNAWGTPSASRHGQRERTSAAPSIRRSVEPVGMPAVPGADTARHGRAIEPDGRSPAQGRAGGVRPAPQVTSSDAGADQAPGGRASGCTDRYHLRPRAQRVQVVRPCLHHLPALVGELRPVVGASEGVGDGVG